MRLKDFSTGDRVGDLMIFMMIIMGVVGAAAIIAFGGKSQRLPQAPKSTVEVFSCEDTFNYSAGHLGMICTENATGDRYLMVSRNAKTMTLTKMGDLPADKSGD